MLLLKTAEFTKKKLLFAFSFVRVFAVVVLFVLFLFPFITVKAENSPLLITEINYAGSVLPNNCKTVAPSANRCGFDKWLEITNIGNSSINLSGWTLRFRQSLSANDNIPLPATLLPSGETFLVAYYEVNFVSALQTAGIIPNYYSGKIRNMSNMENQMVDIQLLDSNNSIIQSIFFNASDLSAFQSEMEAGTKHSIELTNVNSWAVAQQSFYEYNFGTPLPFFSLNPNPIPNPAEQIEFAPDLNFNFSPIYIDIFEEIAVPLQVEAPVAFQTAALPVSIEAIEPLSVATAVQVPSMQSVPIPIQSFSMVPSTVVSRTFPAPLRLAIVSPHFWHSGDIIKSTFSSISSYFLVIVCAMMAEVVRVQYKQYGVKYLSPHFLFMNTRFESS